MLCLSSGGSSNSQTRGAANTMEEGTNLLFGQIFPKLHKKRKLGREESTLNPPMVEGKKK